MWFIGVEVEQETSAPPPKKKSWIRPCACRSSKRRLYKRRNSDQTQALWYRSVQSHGACEFFKLVICLYDERAVLELTLSLLLNEEVMKPFVVVGKGFHF